MFFDDIFPWNWIFTRIGCKITIFFGHRQINLHFSIYFELNIRINARKCGMTFRVTDIENTAYDAALIDKERLATGGNCSLLDGAVTDFLPHQRENAPRLRYSFSRREMAKIKRAGTQR